MKLTLRHLIYFIPFFLLINCSATSTNSNSNRLLLLELTDNLLPSDDISPSLSESILEDESYQYTASIQNQNGTVLYSDLDVQPYNRSLQSYYFNAKLAQNQTYTVQLKLVRHITGEEDWLVNTTQNDESWLDVSNITAEFTVSDNITALNLRTSEWESSFDNDTDGVSNLTELNLGTNPLHADTDLDGSDDSNDAFPLDATETLDSDQDGIGSNADNCPDISNNDQTNIDADDFGDVCDADNDNDGIKNEFDNCPLLSNTSQENIDSDAIGDACDDDRDGDGLSNIDEQIAGTNPNANDSDADGTSDLNDAFPLNASEAVDRDLDGVGDSADNCDNVANTDQTNTDSDADGDACDTDDDDDGVVDSNDNCPTTLSSNSLTTNHTLQIDLDSDGHGTPCDCDDSNETTHPLATDKPDSLMTDANCDGLDGDLANAIPVTPDDDFTIAYTNAANTGLDLYLSEGTHTLTDVQISQNVSIYGGFSSDFSERESRTAVNHTTTLVLQSASAPADEFTGLALSGMNDEVTLASLVLKTNSENADQTVLAITNSNVSLENLQIEGNPLAAKETLIQIENSSLQASALRLTAHANSSSFGIAGDTISGHLTNSIFNMNNATHTTALLLENSEFDIINNTIDAGSHEIGTAYGLQFSNSELNIINNIFITDNSVLQASIRCNGSVTDVPLLVTSNLFLRYSPSNNTIYPAYISCNDSKTYLSTTAELEDESFATELTAADNLVDNRTRDRDNVSTGLPSLLDVNYFIVESATAYIRDQGEDTSDYGVEYDFENDPRNSPPDRGADEY